MRRLAIPVPAVVCSLLAGCYGQLPGKDYGTRSILVLPPLNETSEVTAPYKLLSTMTKPLADRGYYVYPVAIVDHFMKENGLPTPGEMHTVTLKKIDEIIGPDAVLYPTVATWKKPNIVAAVLVRDARSTVKVRYRLVDVKTGDLIWERVQSAKEKKPLPKLGEMCNRAALGRRLPPGPRHPAYRGVAEPLPYVASP